MRFSRWTKTYRSKGAAKRLLEQINDRQAKLEWYDLDRYQKASIVAIGAGGANQPILYQLAMKGIGHLATYDDDRVALPDTTRQYSTIRDVGQYKVHAAAKRLAKLALFPITIKASPYRFQECFSVNRAPPGSLDGIVCGVDNTLTRQAVSDYAQAWGIPAVHVSVGRDANAAAVFVEEPGQASWNDAFPQFAGDTSYPCGLPGAICAPSIAAGMAVAAVDSIICSRPRHWNFRQVYLDGGLPDRTTIIQRQPRAQLGEPR